MYVNDADEEILYNRDVDFISESMFAEIAGKKTIYN